MRCQKRLPLILLALLLAACATAPTAQQTPTTTTAAVPPPSSDPNALWVKGLTTDTRIWASRMHPDLRSEQILVYADGIALLNDSEQFQMPVAEVRALLNEFALHDFATIEEQSPKGKRIRRRAGVQNHSYRREAWQTWEWAENVRLTKLVDALFARVLPFASSGTVKAASLTDGLSKVQSGELAPETLNLMLHIRPEKGSTAEGYLFRTEHGAATVRKYVNGELGPEDIVGLDPVNAQKLAAILLAAQPETLPVNVYASDYTHFQVNVLRHEKEVMARKFTGMTPTQHGEKQVVFNQLVKAIDEVRQSLF